MKFLELFTVFNAILMLSDIQIIEIAPTKLKVKLTEFV